jgi:hypothetical protein
VARLGAKTSNFVFPTLSVDGVFLLTARGASPHWLCQRREYTQNVVFDMGIAGKTATRHQRLMMGKNNAPTTAWLNAIPAARSLSPRGKIGFQPGRAGAGFGRKCQAPFFDHNS